MSKLIAALFAAVAALTVFAESSALAQPAPRLQAEAAPTPAPPPAERPEAAQPQKPETYDSLDAGRDAHAPAERKRRRAIDRQLQANEDIRYYNAWPGPWGRYYARRYGVPHIRAYAPPFAAREAERAIESGLVPAPPGPWPMPSDFFFGPPLVGEPYVDSVEQPSGHEKVWTGPNGYIYRPRHEEPTPARREPTPAKPQPAEPAAVELPGEEGPVAPPSLNPPDEEPTLEPVPGPREF